MLEQLGASDPLLDIALRLEEIALADDYFIERKLYPNVDFYTGLIYKAMGFPTRMFTVLFALGRLPGWIAQWREMIEDPETKIGRPRQVYVGATERDYVGRSTPAERGAPARTTRERPTARRGWRRVSRSTGDRAVGVSRYRAARRSSTERGEPRASRARCHGPAALVTAAAPRPVADGDAERAEVLGVGHGPGAGGPGAGRRARRRSVTVRPETCPVMPSSALQLLDDRGRGPASVGVGEPAGQTRRWSCRSGWTPGPAPSLLVVGVRLGEGGALHLLGDLGDLHGSGSPRP